VPKIEYIEPMLMILQKGISWHFIALEKSTFFGLRINAIAARSSAAQRVL
jgi:hypothetical protein